jgi:heme/copper-type cytochrome/quinol oxidase subunit 2
MEHYKPTTATRFLALGVLVFGASLVVLLAFHQRLVVHAILTIFWAVYSVLAYFFCKYIQRQLEQQKLNADQRQKLEWRLLLVMWMWSISGAAGAVVYAYLTFCDLSKN